MPTRNALRVLQKRRREDAARLTVLRVQIKAGVDALDRGAIREIEDTNLESHLNALASPTVDRRTRTR